MSCPCADVLSTVFACLCVVRLFTAVSSPCTRTRHTHVNFLMLLNAFYPVSDVHVRTMLNTPEFIFSHVRLINTFSDFFGHEYIKINLSLSFLLSHCIVLRVAVITHGDFSNLVDRLLAVI